MKKMDSDKLKKCLIGGVLLLLIPLVLVLGVWLFADSQYLILSMLVAVLSCVPFLIRFERGKSGARELAVIAVMTAFSVIGRLIFAPIPGFKPVSAITVITGIALGPEAGFLIGSLSAIVSNVFFGQGPWTPFQMFVWGLIGFLAGAIFYRRQKINRLLLILIGALSGVLFSLIMSIWTTLSLDGTFLWTRYLASIVSSLPVMLVYAVSNVVFLLILTNPFLEKLNRIKKKYGIFGG